jgi:hypothetical protein
MKLGGFRLAVFQFKLLTTILILLIVNLSDLI